MVHVVLPSQNRPRNSKHKYKSPKVSVSTKGGPVWVALVPSAPGDSFIQHDGSAGVYTQLQILRDGEHPVATFRFQPPTRPGNDRGVLETAVRTICALDMNPPPGDHIYTLLVKNANEKDSRGRDIIPNQFALYRASIVALEHYLPVTANVR